MVTADERSLQEEPDVVYAQDAYAALLLAERFPSIAAGDGDPRGRVTTSGCRRSCPG